ncbi:MAG: endonuclease [Bacteroidales bacterium]|nr:endonuclease [Bacteroidales bacterium]MDD2424820.1 endonuclease [Bacteroidales bacterium]MDD3990062.1 endonuclease [Bacteroidales bacterium]MDD4638268.1 endonuclease [Bacteroidales bacterium]
MYFTIRIIICRIIYLISCSLITPEHCVSIPVSPASHSGTKQERGIRPVKEYKILFWNLENYFDTFDDPATSDNEFTREGERRWSWKRFTKKRNDIAKVILSAGNELTEGEPGYPVLIALSEVENRFVLDQLVKCSPLAMLEYSVIHRNSPDERGIDVALLYRRRYFSLIENKYYTVKAEGQARNTRLILYAKGVLQELDTLHIFVNHWPSKFGGEKISRPYRECAAKTLLMICDSIFMKNKNANIVLTGDFNDTPDSDIFSTFEKFINLAKPFALKGEGTIRYKGVWEMIDMFFISRNLSDQQEPVACGEDAMEIVKIPFLMEKDPVYLGVRPRRCYTGPRYNGGVSDHLPVILKIGKMFDYR